MTMIIIFDPFIETLFKGHESFHHFNSKIFEHQTCRDMKKSRRQEPCIQRYE